jgi:hypothetical protein
MLFSLLESRFNNCPNRSSVEPSLCAKAVAGTNDGLDDATNSIADIVVVISSTGLFGKIMLFLYDIGYKSPAYIYMVYFIYNKSIE